MRKIKSIGVLLSFFFGGFFCNAQVVFNEGSNIIIESGAVLLSEGEVVNTQSGVITTTGTLMAKTSLENKLSSSLKGDGNYLIGGNWINTASFTAGISTVIFNGNTNSDITSSGDAFHHLQLDKTSGGQIELQDALAMTGSFSFLQNNNFAILNSFSFSLGPGSTIISFDADNFFVTNGMGKLRKESMGTFTFPIGFNASSYNPLSLTQSGTLDRIDVRSLENVLADGSSGLPLTDVADASWELSEGTAGGSLLSMTAQWTASDELGSFDRTDCGIAYHDGSCWDLTQALQGIAGGANPYTISRSSISNLGVFAVGGDPLLKPLRIAPKLLLEGPYSSGGEMHDLLRQAGHIPTAEPFTALGYTHVEPGGGESIAPAVLTTTGSNAIVDWVFVEIRTGTGNGTTVATRSALLQKDGDIVDLDGSAPLNFGGIANGAYHVLIRSRNHIGVMSIGTLALTKTATSLDFTTSTANALGGGLTLTDLGDGFFAIFSGDYNGNGQIQNTDANSLILDIGISGYKAGDLDLNGEVQNSELQTILIPNIGKGTQFAY